MPAMPPEITYTRKIVRSTGRPMRRDASVPPPTARTCRPKAVWLMTIAAGDIGSQGNEGRCREAENEAEDATEDAGVIGVNPFGPHEAQQVALPKIGEVGFVGHGNGLVVGQQQARFRKPRASSPRSR